MGASWRWSGKHAAHKQCPAQVRQQQRYWKWRMVSHPGSSILQRAQPTASCPTPGWGSGIFWSWVVDHAVAGMLTQEQGGRGGAGVSESGDYMLLGGSVNQTTLVPVGIDMIDGKATGKQQLIAECRRAGIRMCAYMPTGPSHTPALFK